MFSYLIGSLGFLGAIMLQFGVISRTALLSGFGDLVLLFVAAWSLHQNSKHFWVLVAVFGALVGFISAVPAFVFVIVYLLVYLGATAIRLRVWQSPLLGMFLLTFVGTLLEHVLLALVSLFSGASFSLQLAFNEILLPSVLINMLLAIPVHALIQEISRSIYPQGFEA